MVCIGWFTSYNFPTKSSINISKDINKITFYKMADYSNFYTNIWVNKKEKMGKFWTRRILRKLTHIYYLLPESRNNANKMTSFEKLTNRTMEQNKMSKKYFKTHTGIQYVIVIRFQGSGREDGLFKMVWGKVVTISNNNWISISYLTPKLFPKRNKSQHNGWE